MSPVRGCAAAVAVALTLVLAGAARAAEPPPLLDAVFDAPSGSDAQGPPPSPSRKDLPKRTPRPATCVAFGEYREEMAEDPALAPAEKARLREEAREAYQQALRIDPNHLPAYRALARLYEAGGDYARAAATYEQGLQHWPREAELPFEYGMALARRKEWPQALEHLGAAHNLDPDNSNFAKTLGFSLAMAGHFDESRAVFTPTVGEARAWYNVACVQHHLHEDGLAWWSALSAVLLDPAHEPAKELLAELSGIKPARFGCDPLWQKVLWEVTNAFGPPAK
jgi:tetratricopeptide (TPR) repeat protein